ncbi:MAG: type II toxin-antitoxin system VapC family toxin [Pseudomonadota bacterium]
MTGLDTNVLVRYIVQDEVEQSLAATVLIEGGEQAGKTFFINQIVLCEVVWVVKRCYSAGRDDIGRMVEQILRTASFRVQRSEEAWSALNLYRKTPADFADCLIACGNRAAGCTATATFDRQAAQTAGFCLVSSLAP